MKNIDIIFEDNDILIIDKPYGVVVNRSSTTTSGTVQDYIEENFDFLKNSTDEEFISRSGFSHRLDKDTSGVLVISKNEKVFQNLKNQFKNREVSKEYLAVVLGELKEKRAEINAPIKRNPNMPMKLAIVADGREALTIVEKESVFKKEDTVFTLIQAFPKTGRTHQIRVHLSAINHPIAGDPIYLTRHNYDLCKKYFDRLMLHAHKISFMHPTTGERVSFESKIPEDFSN